MPRRPDPKAGCLAIFLVLPTALVAQTDGCTPPVRPFLPAAAEDVRLYSELLRQDFEAYIADFGGYLRCLDAERARVFEEGQAVTTDYGRFQGILDRAGPVPSE